MAKPVKLVSKERRKRKIRKRVIGTKIRPRLCVSRSNKEIFAQVIDDSNHRTVFGSSTKKIGIDPDKDLDLGDKKSKIADSFSLGYKIGKTLIEKGVDTVVFDRGGLKYHGRVRAVAEGARAAGLKF